MSLISDIFDRFVVNPAANRMVEIMKKDVTPPDPTNIDAFAVPYGYNSQQVDGQRRQTTQATVPFRTLRQLSVVHETTRAAINARKRQITQLEWGIVDVDADTAPNYKPEELNAIRAQFAKIGGPGVRFREILDKLVEDILVLDALVFYKQKTVGGQLLRIIPIDGSTIKLRVDDSGLRPLPPEPAFEQWVNGKRVDNDDLTINDITYASINSRTNSPYGLSPIETLVLDIDASFRALMYNTRYLSDSNVPAGFLAMPETWTPQQIKDFKNFFDTMVSTATAQSRVFPVPSGTTYSAASKPKDFMFKDFFDYLDRKVAMLFDITPQELGLSLQQYKENAEGQDKIQIRKGIKPLANLLEEVFTDVIQIDMALPSLKFKFSGLESRYDLEDVKTLVPLGIISIDEVRTDRALKAIGVNNVIIQGNSVTPIGEQMGETMIGKPAGTPEPTVSGTEQPVEPPALPAGKFVKNASLLVELKAWEKKGLNDLKKKGKITREFESSVIPEDVRANILANLPLFDEPELIKTIFVNFKKKLTPVDVVAESQRSKKFRKVVESALKAQIKPFSKESNIAAIVGTEKLAKDAIDDADVEEYFNSIEIEGLEDFLKWSATQGGKKAYKTLGITGTFQLTNDKFQAMLGDRENYIIDSVDKTTKDWLINQISQGKENALTNREIADKIWEESDAISTYRADMIVNTEVANAMQTSELDTYRDQGIEQKQWLTSGDASVDAECAELDGEIVGVDESFSTGDDAPPLHPNCRCYINAVVDGVADDL